MPKHKVCPECRIEQSSLDNRDGLCDDCYATLRDSWRKMDRLETLGYVE